MNKLFTRQIQAWDKYWFTPGSLTRLAIYRMWAFSIIRIDVLVWTRGHLRCAGAYPVFFNFEKIGAWIRRHITAPRGLTRFAVLFDGQCPLCIRSATTVDFLDWRGKFVFRDVNDWEQIARDYPGLDQQQSLEEMQVIIPRPGGYETLAGFYAFRKIAQHLPLGMLVWPFLFIPGVPFIGTRIYRFIASRRKRVTGGARCSFHTCDIPVPAKMD